MAKNAIAKCNFGGVIRENASNDATTILAIKVIKDRSARSSRSISYYSATCDVCSAGGSPFGSFT